MRFHIIAIILLFLCSAPQQATAGNLEDDWLSLKATVLTSGMVVQRESSLKMRISSGISEKTPEFDLIVEQFSNWVAEQGLPSFVVVRPPISESFNGILLFGDGSNAPQGKVLSACEQFDGTTCVILSKVKHTVSFVIARMNESGDLDDRKRSVMQAIFAGYGLHIGTRSIGFAKKALRFSYQKLEPGMTEAETRTQFEQHWMRMD